MPEATQTNTCFEVFHESYGGRSCRISFWWLFSDEHGRKGEVIGISTGRQVGSPVPGVMQSVIYPHPQSWLLEVSGREVGRKLLF